MSHGIALALLLVPGADERAKVSEALVPAPSAHAPLIMDLADRTITLDVVPTGEQAAGVRETTLLVSTNGGLSWRRVASDPNPPGKTFTYHAPADGLYDFRLRLVFKNGEVAYVPGNLRYRVQTRPPGK